MIKTVLKIDGMMCGMCENHINDALRLHFDIKKVTSSKAKGETVILSENTLDEEKIKKVIGDAGYELKNIETEPYEKSGGFLGLFKKK